ncbi:MAG: vacuolar membrane-associated protein iml1 [Vezdaea aestivalis]|nr:MAG: vacuolar membrane-associated protein iml1 [Vezdaea aestivalis]
MTGLNYGKDLSDSGAATSRADDAPLAQMLQTRICHLSTHNEAFSTEDVLVNLNAFPPGLLNSSDLLSILPLDSRTVVQDFQDDHPPEALSGDNNASQAPSDRKQSQQTDSSNATRKFNLENARCFIFVLKDLTASQRSRFPKLEISVAPHVAQTFGFRNRSKVSLSLVERQDHVASHAEISFRDQYLTRSDMWRLTTSELCNKAIYKGQRVLHLGTIKATVKNIYVQGHKVRSAYFNGHTKPVFRSESARYVLFIQMSKEMWDFDSDGSGEIMFDKVISGFLPDVFKRWTLMGVRHLVTIVLFTRVEYELSAPIVISPELGFHGVTDDGKLSGERPPYKDFYRVVVNEMASGEWATIMFRLKKEYLRFQRDVSTQTTSLRERAHLNTALSLVQEDAEASVPRITGGPSTAIHGNILEAINLASCHFSNDFLDRDLVRTGISIVVVTPGTAIFEVDRDILRLTTDTVIGNGIGLDIVCLSKMPLHSVPLFKYRDVPEDEISPPGQKYKLDDLNSGHMKLGNHIAHGSYISPSQFTELSLSSGSKDSDPTDGRGWKYAVPNWIDVSFWSAHRDVNSQSQRATIDTNGPPNKARAQSELTLRCKMYELQMMGVAENEMSNISIPYLHENHLHPDPVVVHDDLERLRSRSGTSTPTERKLRKPTPSLILGLSKPENLLIRQDRDGTKWMDSYDSGVFHSHQMQRAREKSDRLKRREAEKKKRSTQSHLDGSQFLGTPYSFRDKSPGALNSRVGSAYFDRQMKGRELETQMHKTPRNDPSSSATPLSSSYRNSDKSRKFSFNIRGFNFSPPAATATTQTESVSGIIRTEPRSLDKNQRKSILSVDSPFGTSAGEGSPRSPTSTGTPPKVSKFMRSSEGTSEPINIVRSTEVTRDVPKGLQSRIYRPSILDILDTTSKDQIESEKLDVLQAASRSKQLGPKVELAVGSVGSSAKSYPHNAMAPWLTILNPLNPKYHDKETETQFKRWQHIYPKPLRLSSIKWKSLCSPAAIPLTTECFPSARQLATEYTESPYTVSPNEDADDLSEDPVAREALLMELISTRLSQGFQIVVGPVVTASMGHIAHNLVTSLDAHRLAADGATIIMSMGNVIHQIVCMEGGDIQVKRMIRKFSAASSLNAPELDLTYRPLIRTRLSDSYQMQTMKFGNLRSEYNWNYADSLIAGYESALDEQLRFWRARFVLIPGTPPAGVRRAANLANEDDDEEVRIEGIRKLSQMIQQRAVRSEDEKFYHQPRRLKKDHNPLGISYQTRNASEVIRSEVQGLSMFGPDESGRRSQVYSDMEIFQQATMNLASVAQEMQGSRGIKMQDRRWHWRLHWNCFIGEEFTTWLLESFQDIETRDGAVELGNELMKRGLFKHVEGRHQFRDGNYFYQLSSEYSAARPESRSGWFGSIRSDKSVPSTPLSDHARDDPSASLEKPAPEKEATKSDTPVVNRAASGKFRLSKMLRYDVDPRKKSSRPETINLHYDLLSNPDSCYHLRLDWMNVTPKLIEDVLVTWTSTVERYGLKLVQVPIAEASAVSATNPFRAPYTIALSLPPPKIQPALLYDTSSLIPHQTPDPLFYHKAILKHHDFVLDLEAAHAFPSDANVLYSWGPPSYRYPQYIHRSGLVLVQIHSNGSFLIVDNQRSNSRPSRAMQDPKAEGVDRRPHVAQMVAFTPAPPPPPTAAAGVTANTQERFSPYASPALRATREGSLPGSTILTGQNWAGVVGASSAEQIKDGLEGFCGDRERLRAFLEGVLGNSRGDDGDGEGKEAEDGLGIQQRLSADADESGIPALGLPAGLRRRS